MLRTTTTLGAIALSTILMMTGCSSGETASSASGTTVQVRVLDMSYDPPVVTIEPGDTVEWVWEASLPHDVVSDESAPAQFSSELQTEGSYSQTFDTAGVYAYHCTPHAQMTGEVIVEG